MRNIFKVFGAAFMVMCSVMLCSCDKYSDDDVFYADIEDSGIVTTHDKEINKEYECSEFYINGLCYENVKLMIGTVDSELYCFEVKSNEDGNIIFSQPFCHYGKIFDTKNSIARFDDIWWINDNGSIGKIVLYKSGNKLMKIKDKKEENKDLLKYLTNQALLENIGITKVTNYYDIAVVYKIDKFVMNYLK